MRPLIAQLLARGRERRPLVGAHRGDSAHAPENTLAAFRAAIDAGADLIELDVRLTRDGYLAVIHDADTRRVADVRRIVAASTMALLGSTDVGARHGDRWAGETVPELGDVFALVGSRVLVNVEVKGGSDAALVVARRVAEHGMVERVIVSSFEPAVVASMAALDARITTGLLVERRRTGLVDAARAVGATLLHLEHTLVTPPLAAEVHAAGLGLLAWTANEPALMRRLRDSGVDAILSDDPASLKATLERDEAGGAPAGGAP